MFTYRKFQNADRTYEYHIITDVFHTYKSLCVGDVIVPMTTSYIKGIHEIFKNSCHGALLSRGKQNHYNIALITDFSQDESNTRSCDHDDTRHDCLSCITYMTKPMITYVTQQLDLGMISIQSLRYYVTLDDLTQIIDDIRSHRFPFDSEEFK